MDFEPPVERMLRDAGWRPDRAVGAPVEQRVSALSRDGFPVLDGSLLLLANFGGLQVGDDAPGEECAREFIEFDPSVALGETDRFERFERALGLRFTPLGEVGHGHAFVALGSDGSLYLVMDSIWRAGRSFQDGLTNLLLGRRISILEGGAWVAWPPAS